MLRSLLVSAQLYSPSRTLLRELGMFPELNDLLRASPDRAEPVTRRAVGRGGAGRSLEPGGSTRPGRRAHGPAGRTRCPPADRAWGCSPGRASRAWAGRRARGAWVSAPSRGFSKAVGARERSGTQVRRMDGLRFTNASPEPSAWHPVGSRRPGEAAGEERRGELVLHLHSGPASSPSRVSFGPGSPRRSRRSLPLPLLAPRSAQPARGCTRPPRAPPPRTVSHSPPSGAPRHVSPFSPGGYLSQEHPWFIS